MSESRPHILFLFAEQLRDDCLGCADHYLLRTEDWKIVIGRDGLTLSAATPASRNPGCPLRARFKTQAALLLAFVSADGDLVLLAA